VEQLVETEVELLVAGLVEMAEPQVEPVLGLEEAMVV
jgi:hypothetical protein